MDESNDQLTRTFHDVLHVEEGATVGDAITERLSTTGMMQHVVSGERDAIVVIHIEYAERMPQRGLVIEEIIKE